MSHQSHCPLIGGGDVCDKSHYNQVDLFKHHLETQNLRMEGPMESSSPNTLPVQYYPL